MYPGRKTNAVVPAKTGRGQHNRKRPYAGIRGPRPDKAASRIVTLLDEGRYTGPAARAAACCAAIELHARDLSRFTVQP